ncbi:MAG: superoxide dismutase, partial [Acidimicrobiales bacterium]
LTLPQIALIYTDRIQEFAQQILNHEFFWKCLTPRTGSPSPNVSGLAPFNLNPSEEKILLQETSTRSRTGSPGTFQGGVPRERIYSLLNQQFGSVQNFIDLFSERAIKHFGSGWVWLVYDPTNQILQVIDGQDAYNPLVDGYVPLLNLDLWEHSYYLDYQTNRKGYIHNFWNYVNWNFIENNLLETLFGPHGGTQSMKLIDK